MIKDWNFEFRIVVKFGSVNDVCATVVSIFVPVIQQV